MSISKAGYLQIALMAIRDDFGSKLDLFLDKLIQGREFCVWDTAQAYAAYAVSTDFRRHDNESLFLVGMPSVSAAPFPANNRFVNLNFSSELFTVGTHHRAAQFMQAGPSSLIAAQSQQSLQPYGIHPALLVRDPPNGAKPGSQG